MAIASDIKPLAGYSLHQEIYRGTRTLVYRGIEESRGIPVVIKLPRSEYPSINELVQLRNQYSIAKNLELPGVVQPYSLEDYGNSYALVMEDFGGYPLNDTLSQQPNRRYAIDDFLAIALQLAEILDGLHQNCIIHKDIKPANILINPESGLVKIIDFSLSSLLPRETQEIQSANVLEGTLAYIAPEQTGRMNRGIDYRSDFYSLGVTFYELLTGELPFPGREPIELVHAHIAQTPPSVAARNPNLPPILSEIVAKLMAKNAEARYQSALGLKADLETCQAQWQANGKIEQFELATQDWCDRFMIPEKLYGRAAEIAQLQAAFERVRGREQETGGANSELILVVGSSGIGKTAVINEIHKPIARTRGYFIKGKFDQFNRNIPFSAFIQAFQDLIAQLLCESDKQLQRWTDSILQALGNNGQVLIEIVPQLERIIGKQPAVPELTGSAAQNRFNLLLQRFVAVFARPEHPLVLFLDDLQWADTASLQLLKLLARDENSLLLLGAYRDNEVSPLHPLMLAVEDLKADSVTVNTLMLVPLGFHETNQFVADTLRCKPQQARPLAELLERQARGNPFFLTQLLKTLYEDGEIALDRASGSWKCDLSRVSTRLTTETAAEFVATQLRKLPPTTQRVLQLAACIGNQFDLETLALICEQSAAATADALWKALQEGAIVPQTQVYKFYLAGDSAQTSILPLDNARYRFLHDRVQQAAYSLIDDDQKAIAHHRIGQRLLATLSREGLEERIFELVNHLNYGAALMAREAIESDLPADELARLNLRACRKARAASAYQAARQYAETGLALLGATGWQQQYEMTLELHERAIELTWLCGDLEAMERYLAEILQQARSVLDTVKSYRLRIQALMTAARAKEALDMGLKILRELGVTLPETPTQEEVGRAIFEVEELLAGREIETLIDLPLATDAEKIGIIQVGNNTLVPAVQNGSPLHPVLIALSVRLSILYGNSVSSVMSYATYGLILSMVCKKIERGIQFGQLAFALSERLNAKTVKPEAIIVTYATHHRTRPLRETLPRLEEAYTSSLEVGNIEFAGYSLSGLTMSAFFSSKPLASLDSEIDGYCEELLRLKQSFSYNICCIIHQVVLNWRGLATSPTLLSGTAFQEARQLPQLLASRELNALYGFYLFKLMLCYGFGDIDGAEECATEARRYEMVDMDTLAKPAIYFYDSLSALASVSLYPERQAEVFQRVAENQTRLNEDWLRYGPMNQQHRYDLVEAEKCRILGRPGEALELYDRAISAARTHQFIHEEALAQELAAKFCLAWGKEKVAASYLQDAYYCYARWGAKAKTDDLEQRYSSLLAPILRASAPSLDPLETLSSLTSSDVSLQGLTATSSGSSGSFNNILDFTAILKASQSVSSTLNLEQLLAQLTRIILQHSGGDRCAFILPDANGEWQVEAQATSQYTTLEAEILEGNTRLPLGVIHYVKNTLEIVTSEKVQEKFLSKDPYLLRTKPKSLLALPILNQSKLTGVLYLENKQTADVFTKDRLLILNFLCTQAAISLENARLYRQARDYAQQLEQSQLQIVQSEKMASLGNLVAGVAHEINNPIGFLNGSIDNIKDYIQDLFGHLSLYQEALPQAPDSILDNAEDIELEFLEADLPKVLSSMEGAIERIKGISNSLRTFSRADSEKPIAANLHEGLDSTLLILKYRLKANEKRPAIQIVKNYGDLPEIACFAGQLNQVFMNLLANAIDALDDAAQQSQYGELEANPQQISISTALNAEKNAVEIRFCDNGLGIPEALQERIFEHLFTTKNVGKGTGLGLAIARQIVVEKHGVSLQVHSQPGRGTEFCISLPRLSADRKH